MGPSAVVLDPETPAAWTELSHDALLSLPRAAVREAQLAALRRRFEKLKPGIRALDRLATRQGVDHIGSIEDAIPVFFDHRVYKSYPLSLIEERDFARLTSWLGRLTTHDLSAVSLDGLDSVDAWLTRLDESGMIVGHSTGTTGKLSFIPRSRTEWPAWKNAYFLAQRAATGIDFLTERIPNFNTGYRHGHHMATKMTKLFSEVAAGGDENRHVLYDYAVSSDLLSLAGRLQAAEERGELDQLRIDPKLLEQRKELIERGRHRDDDLQQWFTALVEEYRGQRVKLGGMSADFVRLSLAGKARDVTCDFAPGSVIFTSGGMKGFTDAPDNWQELVKEFFGIDRLTGIYGMSECMGTAPMCAQGDYHFFPYAVPIALDEDARPLPEQGSQTGRMALFDLLSETYWGGFISGDQVTVHWDDDCPCGWKAPRISPTVRRFSEMEGGDDKITCAGTAEAYNEFMDYVSSI